MTLTAKVLRRAGELVEQGWTQDALARDANGRDLDFGWADPTAVKWCALGAIHLAAEQMGCDHLLAWSALTQFTGGSIVLWNNAAGRTQAEIVDGIYRAAELAERGEAATPVEGAR